MSRAGGPEDQGRSGNRSKPAATTATVIAEPSKSPTAMRMNTVPSLCIPPTGGVWWVVFIVLPFRARSPVGLNPQLGAILRVEFRSVCAREPGRPASRAEIGEKVPFRECRMYAPRNSHAAHIPGPAMQTVPHSPIRAM